MAHSRLLQNPPAIPTLAVVKVVAFFTGSRVIIDWHNTGYSVLALRLGEKHTAVSLARSYVVRLGASANVLNASLSIVVTKARACTGSNTSGAGEPTHTCASRTRCASN